MKAHDFERIVRARLDETGESAIGLARRSGLPRDAIRSVLRGHPPSLVRAKQICDAIGLRLSIGLPQDVRPHWTADTRDGDRTLPGLSGEVESHMQGLVRAVAAAGGDPIPPEMRAAMAREQGARRGRDAPASGRTKRTAAGAVVIPFAADVRLAAGSGELVWNETAEMSISLARSALPAWTRPDRLRCARVVGDSMSPTIGDGDLVVVDPGRTEPLDGQAFGIHTDGGLAVKRLRNAGGRWHLESDNPAHEPRPITEEMRVVGQVAWWGPPTTGSMAVPQSAVRGETESGGTGDVGRDAHRTTGRDAAPRDGSRRRDTRLPPGRADR